MKRKLITLCALAAAAAGIVAQPRFTSNIETNRLGQVAWKQPVSVQYLITNTGNLPLVVTEVEPDCECSAVQWTQTPISPGGQGTIDMTFDARALGRFSKSVAVFSNAQSAPVYLHFNGEVVREVKDFSRSHPFLIGEVRIDTNSIDFPDIRRGEHPVMHIGVANLSAHPYEPILMHLPPYLRMEAEPTVLQAGEKGILTLTLLSERLTDLGLTQTSVYLSRFAGDKVGEENEIPVSIIVLPDFSELTEIQRLNAPAVSLSTQALDMSEALAHRPKAWRDITVTNTGRSTLRINKLQVFHPAVSVHLKKNLLQPGESTRLRVTVVKRNIGKKRRHLRLLMITNDPALPKVEIGIKR